MIQTIGKAGKDSFVLYLPKTEIEHFGWIKGKVNVEVTKDEIKVTRL